VLLPPVIVGSLPKPAWLAEPRQLRAAWRLEGDELLEGQDDATTVAIHQQERAGLMIITDGEQRRQHYISHFCQGLPAFDYTRLVDKTTRGGKYAARVPTIVDKVRWSGPVLLRDLAFSLSRTTWPVKITLPGPMTIADTAHAEAYADEEELIMDLAAAINEEAKALAQLLPGVIQIDEPAFNAEPDKAGSIGMAALNRAIEGVPCTTAVHICYGYGTDVVLNWKKANTSWGQYEQLLPLLAETNVTMLSLEFAAPKLDPAVLELAGNKRIAFGCVDVSPEQPEPIEVVAERIRGALKYVPPERLYPSTDCGMAPLDRALAVAKMRLLGQAAALVGNELG
jgi:5-methyltetrahydropteroyltriglutamate--homocysteine methyltransferase